MFNSCESDPHCRDILAAKHASDRDIYSQIGQNSTMYAVIFKAQIKTQDPTYASTAERLRELALQEYGCLEFTSTTQGSREIAISYWPSKTHIQAWKNNAEHQQAQALGKSGWYESYQVEIV